MTSFISDNIIDESTPLIQKDETFSPLIDESTLLLINDENNKSCTPVKQLERMIYTPDFNEETITLPDISNLNINENKSSSTVVYHHKILGDLDLPSCEWGYNSGKILNPQCDQLNRRRMRKPLTVQYDRETLYSFIISLLTTALELELNETDSDVHYYSFNPYYTNNMDEFAKKSYNREIGIKTSLKQEYANIILTCYYVLYNNFKQTTSDEIIFEDLYREGVLMQDDNFTLAKFYEELITKNFEVFESVKSLVAECLELKPFPNRTIQFNIWVLTYSNQTQEVKSKDSNRLSGFISIFDLIEQFNDTWFNTKLPIKSSEVESQSSFEIKTTSSSEVETMTNVSHKYESDDSEILNVISNSIRYIINGMSKMSKKLN